MQLKNGIGAARLGADFATFCAVRRDPADPRRPATHVPLDGFWRKRGYQPLPGVIANFHWRDLGDAGETTKQLQFWMKPL